MKFQGGGEDIFTTNKTREELYADAKELLDKIAQPGKNDFKLNFQTLKIDRVVNSLEVIQIIRDNLRGVNEMSHTHFFAFGCKSSYHRARQGFKVHFLYNASNILDPKNKGLKI